MVVLVTAFDAFGGEVTNASWEALERLPDNIAGNQIIKKQLPTVFGKSFDVLTKYIEEFNPALIICLGQAAGRRGITVERVGINIDDARMPDNEGNQPIDKCIREEAKQAAYFSTLPIKAMVEKISRRGIEASVSNTAGTFVCNHILFNALHYAVVNKLHYRAGFIHVPSTKEQAEGKPDMPYMELMDIVKGLEAAIEVACQRKEDIRLVGGTIF